MVVIADNTGSAKDHRIALSNGELCECELYLSFFFN